MQHNNSKKAKIVFQILGEIVKEQRLKTGKSLRLISDEFDLQKSMLSRIENGLNEPKLISLMSVCEALNIKMSDLFKLLEEKLPEDFFLSEK